MAYSLVWVDKKEDASTLPSAEEPSGDVSMWNRWVRVYRGRLVKFVSRASANEVTLRDVKLNKEFTVQYDDKDGDTWGDLPSTFHLCNSTLKYGVFFAKRELLAEKLGQPANAFDGDPKWPRGGGDIALIDLLRKSGIIDRLLKSPLFPLAPEDRAILEMLRRLL